MTPAKELIRLVLLTLVSIWVSVTCAWSQATWGTISGFVTDPSGAAVPNANITIQNEQTGVQTKAATDSAGLYNVTHLDPGEYTVKAEASGFQTFVRQHVVLQVDSTARVDPKMTLGQASEEVTVSAGLAEVESQKTDVSTTISQHEIDSLPIVNHNVTKLYLEVPGVTQNFIQIGNVENPSEGQMTTTNGQMWTANNIQVDGIDDIQFGWSGIQFITPPENSIQELKITTNDFDPEYSSVGGMVAQYVTKSGTNALHGDAYWFNENSAFFAANPFTEKVPGTGPHGTGTGPAYFNDNVGGASLGGPLIKNRMFLFGDYRLDKRSQGGNNLLTVPNNTFRNGDFSALASTHPIFDPATGNPDGSGRQQFSCNGVLNVICPSRFSPVAVNLLKLLPPPNINQNTDINYLASGKSPLTINEFDERFDWNISDRDRFYIRDSYMWSTIDVPPAFGIVAEGPPLAGPYATNALSTNQLAAVNYTRTFSPTLLAEFRAGVTRFVLNSYQPDSNLQTDTQVGIPNINTSSPMYGGLGGFFISGPTGGFQMGNAGTVPRLDRSTVLQFVNNWTKVSGNHEIRWGADLRRNREDLLTLNQSTRGDFDFNQSTTGTPSVPGSGLGMASFLLGALGGYQQGVAILFPSEHVNRFSFYGGDVWKVTPKLTLSYGLRWDYFQPVTPAHPGGDVNYDLDTGQLIIAGLGNVTMSSDVRPRYNNFAPRLGLAYRLTQNTVLRVGLGRTYFENGFDAVFNHLSSSYPIAQSIIENPNNQYSTLFPLTQGPPAPTPPAFPANGLLTPPQNTQIKNFAFDRKIPSIDSWNFTVEQKLAGDFLIDLGYVGSKGTHIDYSYYNINAAPPGPGDLLSRRPYYQKFGFNGNIYLNCDCDDTEYNALQVRAIKRFSNGYSINSGFTWAKDMDNEVGNRGGQPNNPYDRRASHGVSFMNHTVVWTLMHTYQLPYGKNQRFGSHAPAIIQAVLGDWRFDGVTTAETGLALSPSDSNSSTLNADFGQRPNVVLGTPLYPATQSRNLWFNPAHFATPPVCCVWGNAGAGTLRGPGLFTANWALGKEFVFATPLNREATRLEFRWETFNAFNHANLANPTTDINSVNVGKIFNIQTPMRQMQFVLHLRF